MIELTVKQGTREWLLARAGRLTASEAPAMMGVSQYKTRAQLIKEKATGYVPEPDAATLARFAAGHDAEAKARPIVETIIRAALYPIVATDDTGKFLASSDGVASEDGGITFLPVGFEHKIWNEKLAEEVRAGNVPDSHAWQLDHQAMVFDFERLVFVVSDGTENNMVYCWYYPSKERIERLKAGWAQFEIDVANFQPEESKAPVVAEPVSDLPAVFVQVTGSVSVADNFDLFGAALRDFIDNKLIRKPQTDQDFADLEAQIKSLKKAEDALDAAEQQMIAQVASVDAMKRAKEALHKLARDNRLLAEKLVKTEKENRKAELVSGANRELSDHLATLLKRVGVMIPVVGNMSETIKGLKSLDSMRDKLSAALANAKIEANAIADRIDLNRKTVEDMSLFPDFAQVCMKQPEDFAALLSMRKMQRQEAEAKRLEQEREKIRFEEQAKAQREAQAEANRIAAEQFSKAQAQPEAAPQNQQPEASNTGTAVTPLPGKQEAAPQDNGATMKLGEICARLGFTVSADFLASLGVSPSGTDRSAKLYPASKFPTICRLISDHVLAMAFKKAA